MLAVLCVKRLSNDIPLSFCKMSSTSFKVMYEIQRLVDKCNCFLLKYYSGRRNSGSERAAPADQLRRAGVQQQGRDAQEQEEERKCSGDSSQRTRLNVQIRKAPQIRAAQPGSGRPERLSSCESRGNGAGLSRREEAIDWWRESIEAFRRRSASHSKENFTSR